jgi:alpha-1,3-rhamnosyl/mannosyltransferase
MQTVGAEASFGVLLGVDGIDRRRSGVGRVMLEMVRHLPGSDRLAALSLVLGNVVMPAAMFDAITEPCEARLPNASPGIVHNLARRCPGVLALHGWRRRRRLDRAARDMSRRTGRAVLYHEANMIARPFTGPTVVTMHDLSWRAHPELYPPAFVAWIEGRLPATLRQATRFVSVSEFTARAMVTELGIDRRRIDVVSPGVSPVFRPMPAHEAVSALARFGLTDRGYMLAVSTVEPRKNFGRLLAAHACLPSRLRARTPLVIAGGRGWGHALDDDAAMRAQADGTLRLLGHVPDADLAALYARAAVVAYPSLYEGFGLPVLEAMACGTPVVTSDGTALRDTAGDAALLVDPLDIEAMAGALRRVLEDRVLADTLRVRGVLRAARFSWDRMATGMIDSWRAALAA